MGRKSLERRRIEVRLAEIISRLEEVEAERDALHREADELRTADIVLMRLAGEKNEIGPEEAAEVSPAFGDDMTIADMTLVILYEAGSSGLTSSEVLDQLRKRWLPNLMRTSLSPPLSRLKSRNVIELIDDRWRIRD
jgi:hypothetical protein